MWRQLFKQLALSLLGILCDFFEFTRRSLIQTGQQDQPLWGEQQGSLERKALWPRAVAVAINPGPFSAPFLANLLGGLAENGFFILVVAGKKLPEDLKTFVLSHCHHLIEKFSLGNFDSYKTGCDWIGNCEDLKEINILALVNDSVYYPRRISSTIGQMLEQEHGWLRLFENSQTPAQSFFQIFRPSVFKAEPFTGFWRNYVLTSQTDFTNDLQNAGFSPHAYYNAERLRTDITMALNNENVPTELQDVLNLTLGFERRGDVVHVSPRSKDTLALPIEEVVSLVGELAAKDPVHSIGLLCNYLYQAPVKRDICQFGSCSVDDLLDLAQGFSAEEKDAMSQDLQQRHMPANLTSLREIPQRILQAAGRK